MSPLAPPPTQAAWHQAPDLTRCLDKPHLAAAFAEDAVVRLLDVDGVEAVLREPADRSRTVLGLHNPSTDEARINLHGLLPEHAESTWHFISGAMHTRRAADGMYVHLAASGHVWLTATP
ncbi:hypothetical protein ACFYY3_27775 [Streptomyces sp. NPDC001812]|uniref:hypothetical protein n=1 Tax=Streptomyces sp. NPDC001812 TaxID=3364611 RepID=UPI0036989E9C